jgi:hypothetical protein
MSHRERFSVENVKQMFAGEPDECERLVAAIQYCAFIPAVNTFSNAVIVTLLEKGVLYRGMLDLGELSLLDQCFYIHNKFTEFHERSVASAPTAASSLIWLSVSAD